MRGGALDALGRSQELGLQLLKQQRSQQDGERYEQREPHVFGYPDAPSVYTADGTGRPDGLHRFMTSHAR
jgi:hypothetical protein